LTFSLSNTLFPFSNTPFSFPNTSLSLLFKWHFGLLALALVSMRASKTSYNYENTPRVAAGIPDNLKRN
jgi:hypothetical protein